MEDIYIFLELRMINRAQGGLNSMRLLMWIRWTPGWPPTHGLEDLPPQELEFEHSKNFKEAKPPLHGANSSDIDIRGKD